MASTLIPANLLQIGFPWTSGNNVYAPSAASLTNALNTTVNTLAGNDKIESILTFESGFSDNVSFSTADVNNFAGTPSLLFVGSAISNLGTILMEAGNDRFIGSLSIGTAASPRTLSFLGEGSSEFTGFLNGATPNTITFPDPGVPNPATSAVLNMGTGNDEVLGDVKVYSKDTLEGAVRARSPLLGLLPNLRASGVTNISPLIDGAQRSVINLGGASGNLLQNLKKLTGSGLVNGVTLAAGKNEGGTLFGPAAEVSVAGISNLVGLIQSGNALTTIDGIAELSAITKELTTIDATSAPREGIAEATGYASLAGVMALGNQVDTVQGKVRLGDINLDALTAAGIQLNTLGPNGISTLDTGAGSDIVLGEVRYIAPSSGNVVKATDLTLVGITLDRGSKLLTGLGADRITGRVDLSAAPIREASNNLPEDGRISAFTLGVGSEINTTASTAKRADDADSIVVELLGIDPLLLPPNNNPPSPSLNEARNIVGIFSKVTSSSDAPSAVRLGAGDDSLNAGIFGFAAAFDFAEPAGTPNLPGGKPDRTNLALGSVVYDLGADNDTVTGFGTGTFQGGTGTDTVRLFNLAKLFDQAAPFVTQTIYEWDVDTKTLTFAASNVDGTLGSGRQFEPRVMKLVDFESIAAVGGNTLALAAQDGVYAVTDSAITFTAQPIG